LEELGNLSSLPDWKSKFYASYVSSGHAADAVGSAEDFLRPRKTFLVDTISTHVPPDRSSRIVDLACGPGALLYFLERAGYQNIVGVDVSEEQIAIARKLGVTSAVCATFEEFLSAQSPASADVVFAIDILEHFTRPQILDVLASIRRILKPGGRCIAHVPNSDGIFGMAVRYADFTHEIAFNPISARQVFRIVEFREVRCFEDKPRVHGFTSLVRRLIWDVGTLPSRILMVAETGVTEAILSQNMMIEAIV